MAEVNPILSSIYFSVAELSILSIWGKIGCSPSLHPSWIPSQV